MKYFTFYGKKISERNAKYLVKYLIFDDLNILIFIQNNERNRFVSKRLDDSI